MRQVLQRGPAFLPVEYGEERAVDEVVSDEHEDEILRGTGLRELAHDPEESELVFGREVLLVSRNQCLQCALQVIAKVRADGIEAACMRR